MFKNNNIFSETNLFPYKMNEIKTIRNHYPLLF